jgi:hypothetical protein
MIDKNVWVGRFLLSAIMALGIAVSGCSGNEGAQGPEGPEGPEGPPGEPGEPGGPPLDLEPDGLVGRILDARVLPVGGGTVYLIPTADVEALFATEIDLQLSPLLTSELEIDEPLDDLIDTKGPPRTSRPPWTTKASTASRPFQAGPTTLHGHRTRPTRCTCRAAISVGSLLIAQM